MLEQHTELFFTINWCILEMTSKFPKNIFSNPQVLHSLHSTSLFSCNWEAIYWQTKNKEKLGNTKQPYDLTRHAIKSLSLSTLSFVFKNGEKHIFRIFFLDDGIQPPFDQVVHEALNTSLHYDTSCYQNIAYIPYI